MGGVTYRGVVLDVDGTVVRGDDALPGALAGLAAVERAGLRRLFVSNNPTGTPESYAERLGRAGIDADPAEVVTAGSVTAAYLAEHHPDAATFVVGEAGLTDQLRRAGVDPVEAPERAEVVVGSIDREFDYDRLCEAFWALRGGATFLGTDPDMVVPAADRDRPGSGAIINAIAGVAGREPDRMLGKPAAPARAAVLERLDLPPEDCLVVGDRPDTDVALGERAGMATALVLTGVADRSDLAAADVTPDYVLDSLAELAGVLGVE